MTKSGRLRAAWIAIIACIAFLAGMAGHSSICKKTGCRWAVLVGINEYMKEVTPLHCAVNDARELSRALIANAGFDESRVFVLTSESRQGNRMPDRSNIIRWISYIKSNASQEDTFVFFFSGHGMDRDRESYLLTCEADPSSSETLAISALAVSDLRRILKDMPVSRILLFIDACRDDPYAGKGGGDNVMTDIQSRNLVVSEGRASRRGGSECSFALTFFSCSIGQRSYEWNEKGMGFFSYHLLKGLQGGAADRSGNITLASLRSYVAKAVPDSVQREKGTGLCQNPWVKGDESALAGDWILCRSACGPGSLSETMDGTSMVGPGGASVKVGTPLQPYLDRSGPQADDPLKPFPGAPDLTRAGVHRDHGDTYLLGKSYQKAIHEYSEAVRWDPGYLAAWESLGDAYVKIGEYQKGISAYSHAIAVNPQNTEYLVKRGIACGKNGEYAKALCDFDKALELKPRLAIAYYHRGCALEGARRYREALDAYRRYIELAPPSEEEEKQSVKARIVQLERQR